MSETKTDSKNFIIPQTKRQPMTNDIKHEFLIVEDIVYFALKGRALTNQIYAVVSLNKWPHVSMHQWYLGKNGYPICYELGKMPLHRFIYSHILGFRPPSNVYIDHIDRDKLNNIDFNLRPVSAQQNSFNKSTNSNRKGVRKISTGNYTATLVKNGERHEIKGIPTSEQAAEIYNLMAEELFGEFAAPNRL